MIGFCLSGFYSLQVVTMQQVVVFIGADGAAVPGFDTEEGCIFSIRGPEGDGLKAGIGYLHTAAGLSVN